MALLKLRVEPDGAEPYELEVLARDVYVWERAGRDRAVADLKDRPRLVDLAELAHAAARRTGKTSANLEEFLATTDVNGVDDDEDAEALDPTPPAP